MTRRASRTARRRHERGRPRSVGAGPWLGRASLCAAVVLLVGAPLFPIGTAAAAPPAGAPSLQGAYIINDGQALVEVGYIGLFDVWTSVGNNSQVYSQAFYLVFFNLHTTGTNVSIGVYQSGGWVLNTSVFIPAISQAATTLTLPANPKWVDTTLYFEGTPYWAGQVATPISFLPNYILDVGGLDAFALAIVYTTSFLAVGALLLAKWMMKRAAWAPPVRLAIWGHVVCGIIAGAILLDFQQIDQTFAGWSPLVYPFAIFPLLWSTFLSHFNRAQTVEVVEGTRTPQGDFGVLREELRIARLPNGRLIWVSATWGQFWARFWGHYAYVDTDDGTKAKPWLAPVLNRFSPTDSPRARRRAAKQAGLPPLASDALTRFPVLNDAGAGSINYFAFGKGGPTEPEYPKLVFHRTVEIVTDAVTAPNPNGGPPLVVTPEKRVSKRKVAWPHYTTPTKATARGLEDTHFIPAALVIFRFANARDLGRLLSKTGEALAQVMNSVENRVQDEVFSRLRSVYTLTGRSTAGLTDEDARAADAELPDLLGRNREGGPSP